MDGGGSSCRLSQHDRPVDARDKILRRRRRGHRHRVAFDVGGDLRKLVHREHGLIGKNHGAEHGVLELADIAGPGIALEHGARVGVDAVDALALLGGEAGDEVADELRHVLKPLAQWGHPDGEHVQPVIEILAEAALIDEADQILSGRRDQAEIDLGRVPGADRIDVAVLQGAQQLHLSVERQLPDLVEEQRALVGLDELAGALLGGAGEGALLVAEQDALHQILGDGAAIDGYEGLRFAGAGAGALDGAGDQLLADARFAFDEDGNRRIGGPAAELDDPRHGFASRNQVGKAKLATDGGLDADQLVGKGLDLERVLDGDLESFRAHRLDHEVDGARPHRRDRRVDAAMGRLYDGRRLARQGPHGG